RLGGRRHGQERLGLSQAAQLPRRDRGRDFLPQASLRFGPLHLARARSLQDLHLVRGGGAQPGAARPPQTGIAPGPRPATSMTAGQINSICRPVLVKRFLRSPPPLPREGGEPPPTTPQPAALLNRQKTRVYGRA